MLASSPPYLVTYPMASMAAMVSSENRTRCRVPRNTRPISPGRRRRARPDRMPVRSRAVPVADSGKNSYTAFSAVSLATTGGVRTTSRCSHGQ
jgi:hypothetical protein